MGCTLDGSESGHKSAQAQGQAHLFQVRGKRMAQSILCAGVAVQECTKVHMLKSRCTCFKLVEREGYNKYIIRRCNCAGLHKGAQAQK